MLASETLVTAAAITSVTHPTFRRQPWKNVDIVVLLVTCVDEIKSCGSTNPRYSRKREHLHMQEMASRLSIPAKRPIQIERGWA